MDIQADIVINGGSFSACAAALAAARTEPDAVVLLIEPTDWLGGQATTQGVAAIDNAWHAPGNTIMRDNPPLYYAADYLDFLNRLKSPPVGAPGHGMAPNGSAWVTREAFDPRTGAYILDRMMEEQTNISVLKLTVMKSALISTGVDELGNSRRINSMTLVQRAPKPGHAPFESFTSTEVHDWWDTADSAQYSKTIVNVTPRDSGKGMVVIEASETGDAMVLSGATYTVGRELTTEKFSEAGAPPALDQDGSQSFVYPFCMTLASTTDSEAALKAPFPDFDAYYANQSSTFFSFGTSTWQRIWTYRRLYNAGATGAYDTVNFNDVSMQNWGPGNDYPYGTMLLGIAAAQSEAADWHGGLDPAQMAAAEKHAIAWYFYMKGRRPGAVTNDTRLPHGSDAENMMDTGSGLSKWPYIRCGRRIVGVENFTIRSREFDDTESGSYDGKASFRYFDSVGIGNYASDVHGSKISTGIVPPISLPAPFYIPYRALTSANVRNLLACGKSMAQTYVTNAGYRLHPIEWASGSAAGVAAALMHREGLANFEMLDPAPLLELQQTVNTNSPISWESYDDAPVPLQYGEIIVNDRDDILTDTPFDIEVYYPRGARAVIFADATLVGETTTRANGRLLKAAVTLSTVPSSFSADVYDAENNKLGTVVTGGGGLDARYIVDDQDGRFSTSGSWTSASAQADKWASSYQYKFGNTGAGSATFANPAPVAGRYKVYAWWPASSNRATDAPYTIHHSAGQTTVKVNQQTNGGQWNLLGEFEFAASAGEKVVLSNAVADTTKLVVADAIRVEPLDSPLPQKDGWAVR